MSASEATPVAVIGAGAWGTALAAALVRNGVAVRLWGRDDDVAASIRDRRQHPRYLAGVTLPAGIEATTDWDAAIADARAVLIATPSHTFREMLRALAPTLARGIPLIWACKGIEPGTQRLLHEIVAEASTEPPPYAVVSGPSFAGEVARGLPTALTVAATDAALAERAVGWLHGGGVRAYANPDVAGVVLAGALKNVYAIACGVADGLGFGANARAAVITRGLAELTRLGDRLGCAPATFTGLAGMGDLVLTCTDDQSRNRRFGLALARGLDVDTALAEIGQAVEGVRTAHAARALAQVHGVDMPIVEQVAAVIHDGSDTRSAVSALLERDPKHEVAPGGRP
jgi:glycerol-3-phosphate dehydrogenase (NAD(P)+)